MKTIESYETRCEMVQMHEQYLNHLEHAMKNKEYIEACWLCYAIFEQRITRLVKKYIEFCPKKRKQKGVEAAISTRITCIRTLIENHYYGFENLNDDVFEKIKNWCSKRNKLVHELVSLRRYKKYDQEFEYLAKKGYPLVKELYEQATIYRNWWNQNSKVPSKRFPASKCRCEDFKCIYEKNKSV